MFIHWRPKPHQTVEDMLTPADNNWGPGPSLHSPIRFGHGGSNDGFRCVTTAFLDRGQGVVVMTNSENRGQLANQILYTIAREYGWPEPGPPQKVEFEYENAVVTAMIADGQRGQRINQR